MVKKLLKHGAQKTLELAKLKPYQKPQKLRCGYSVVVKNISEKKASYTVVMPLPIDTSAQRVISRSEFRPDPESSEEQINSGNKVAYWKIDLDPQHSATFNQYFEIERKPISVKINPEFKLTDYDKKSPEYKSFIKKSKSLKSSKTKEIAEEVMGEEENLAQLISRVHKYVSGRLNYGDPIEGLYSVEDALSLSKVDCGGFSTLFINICQQIGIPARLVSGFWATQSTKTPSMHAWAEAMLPDGTWVPMDISTEVLRRKSRSLKFASFGKIGSDRIVLSHGCDFNFNINGHKIYTEILQNPIVIPEKNSAPPHTEIEFSSKIFK